MRLPLALPLLLAGAALVVPGPAAPASAAPLAFETIPLEFQVTTGPSDELTCTVVGDLRIPAGVTPANPAPGAVLATNGFGGSKDGTGPNGNGSYAARFAEEGYVTLSYSGLGFGGSGCNIYVDDPAYDGKAGAQLVQFLGGRPGLATRDGQPFDIAGLVRQDPKGSDGQAHDFDPRVAMIGGSYGGQIQFAIASVEPRLDAIAPVYTWNDLGYSLAPNNALTGPRVIGDTPGVWKLGWQSLFFGLGVAAPVLGSTPPLEDPTYCGGYAPWICQAYVEQATLGYPSQATLDKVKQVSTGYYIDKIKIPVLLSQGQADSLFNIHEAVATYDQLEAQGNEVRMLWQSWGHTAGTPVAGELDTGTLEAGSADLRDTYQGRVYLDWMAHWLKDAPTDLGPAVRWFRDHAYVPPTDPSDKAAALRAATAAYASAPSYPVGTETVMRFSGGSDLVAADAPIESGSAVLTATGAVGPGEGEVVVSGVSGPVDAPGTTAAWTSAPLTAPVDVAGIPELTVHLSAPQVAAVQSTQPQGKLMLFARLYDVGPDGTATLVRDQVSAVRVPDVTKPVDVTLPGIVHRFDTGHSLRVVLAANDATYKGLGIGGPVTITDSTETPNVLRLPVARAQAAPLPAAPPVPAAPPAAAPSPGALPSTGLGALPALLGVVMLGTAVALRRRRA